MKISRLICLHLKLIASHLHGDLLAKWRRQRVSAAAPLVGLHWGGSILAKTLKHRVLTFSFGEQAAAECTKVA